MPVLRMRCGRSSIRKLIFVNLSLGDTRNRFVQRAPSYRCAGREGRKQAAGEGWREHHELATIIGAPNKPSERLGEPRADNAVVMRLGTAFGFGGREAARDETRHGQELDGGRSLLGSVFVTVARLQRSSDGGRRTRRGRWAWRPGRDG